VVICTENITPIDIVAGNNITYNVFDYSIYSPSSGITNASIIMLCQTSTGDFVVVVSYNTITTLLPYNITSLSKCLATKNSYLYFFLKCKSKYLLQKCKFTFLFSLQTI